MRDASLSSLPEKRKRTRAQGGDPFFFNRREHEISRTWRSAPKVGTRTPWISALSRALVFEGAAMTAKPLIQLSRGTGQQPRSPHPLFV